MPDKINYIEGRSLDDIKKVRIPGLNKPFEEMTISELVQMRPGAGGEAADTWSIEGFSSDISVSSSSNLANLAKRTGQAAVEREIAAAKLRNNIIVNRIIH